MLEVEVVEGKKELFEELKYVGEEGERREAEAYIDSHHRAASQHEIPMGFSVWKSLGLRGFLNLKLLFHGK